MRRALSGLMGVVSMGPMTGGVSALTRRPENATRSAPFPSGRTADTLRLLVPMCFPTMGSGAARGNFCSKSIQSGGDTLRLRNSGYHSKASVPEGFSKGALAIAAEIVFRGNLEYIVNYCIVKTFPF